MQMLEMGIPRANAELALEETGNVGVEVATEWLFLVPQHVLTQHLEERAAINSAHGPGSCRRDSRFESRDLDVPLSLEPRRAPLADVRVVAAGAKHTVVLTDKGVFAWGANAHGQLGLGDTESRALPCQVLALDGVGEAFVQASCGEAHTLLLAASGCVYGCGDCAAGQLTQRGTHVTAAAAAMRAGSGEVPPQAMEVAAAPMRRRRGLG
eukprot:172261-Chlamydomonas_euryale.AAC.1